MIEKVVVLADGQFPQTDLTLAYLNEAERIICCDGAVQNLVNHGLEPSAIVGDMDSIPAKLKSRYKSILNPDKDENTNDLTKAIKYCLGEGMEIITILGATGLRDDHSLGNISLLADYSEYLSVKMISDYGIFIPVNSGDRISSWPGQQVSVFSMDPGIIISSENLRYPIIRGEFSSFWMGTLNESTSDYFSLSFDAGRVLVYLAF